MSGDSLGKFSAIRMIPMSIITLSSAAATDFALRSLAPAPYEMLDCESILVSFRANRPTVFSTPFATFGLFLFKRSIPVVSRDT